METRVTREVPADAPVTRSWLFVTLTGALQIGWLPAVEPVRQLLGTVPLTATAPARASSFAAAPSEAKAISATSINSLRGISILLCRPIG